MEPYEVVHIHSHKETEAPRGEIGLTVFWLGIFCVKAVLIGGVGLQAAYFSDFPSPIRTHTMRFPLEELLNKTAFNLPTAFLTLAYVCDL